MHHPHLLDTDLLHTSTAGKGCPFCCSTTAVYIKILCPQDPEIYTPLALKGSTFQHWRCATKVNLLSFALAMLTVDNCGVAGGLRGQLKEASVRVTGV